MFAFFLPLLLQSPMRRRGGDTDVLSTDEHSTLTILSTLTSYESLKDNCCPLQREASLITAESSINLWV